MQYLPVEAEFAMPLGHSPIRRPEVIGRREEWSTASAYSCPVRLDYEIDEWRIFDLPSLLVFERQPCPFCTGVF